MHIDRCSLAKGSCKLLEHQGAMYFYIWKKKEIKKLKKNENSSFTYMQLYKRQYGSVASFQCRVKNSIWSKLKSAHIVQ